MAKQLQFKFDYTALKSTYPYGLTTFLDHKLEEMYASFAMGGFRTQQLNNNVADFNKAGLERTTADLKIPVQIFLPIVERSRTLTKSKLITPFRLSTFFQTDLMGNGHNISVDGSTTYVLDSVIYKNIDKKNFSLTFFASVRQNKVDYKKSNTAEPVSLINSPIVNSFIYHFEFKRKGSYLHFGDNCFFQTSKSKTSLKPKYPNKALEYLYVLTSMYLDVDFFTMISIPQRILQYRSQIKEITYLGIRSVFPRIKSHADINTLALKNWIVRNPGVHDLVDNPLYTLQRSSSSTSFIPVNNSSISYYTDKYTPNYFVTLIRTTHTDRFSSELPFSRWAMKKTAVFYKNCSEFLFDSNKQLHIDLYAIETYISTIYAFYCMYHTLYSNDLTSVDEDFPIEKIFGLLMDHNFPKFNVHNIPAERITMIPMFTLKDMFERTIAVRSGTGTFADKTKFYHELIKYTSIPKARRIIVDSFVNFPILRVNDNLTLHFPDKLPNDNVSSYLQGMVQDISRKRQSFNDCMRMLRSFNNRTDVEDKLYTEIPWRDITSVEKLHAELVKFQNAYKFPNAQRSNKVYDIFFEYEGLCFIPETEYKLVFANDTKTIRDWGSDQRHCIGNYSDYLNRSDNLIFGVWDIKKNAWFGHCTMIKTTSPKVGWRISQFYGKQNSHLPEEEKAKIIEYLMQTLSRPIISINDSAVEPNLDDLAKAMKKMEFVFIK